MRRVIELVFGEDARADQEDADGEPEGEAVNISDRESAGKLRGLGPSRHDGRVMRK